MKWFLVFILNFWLIVIARSALRADNLLEYCAWVNKETADMNGKSSESCPHMLLHMPPERRMLVRVITGAGKALTVNDFTLALEV